MDVYEAISRRQTIRDFEDKAIPFDLIRKLLDAGIKAPSNDHMRKWEFILLQDRAKREELICYIDAPQTVEGALNVVNQWGLTNPLQRTMYIDAIPKQHSMILNAACLVIPCFHMHTPLLKPANLSALNSFASIWCCIENILVAAASEGIFGVTRIPIEEESKRLKDLLNIPDGYEVPCLMALGYPKATAKRPPQVKIHLDDKIHFDKW